MTTEQEKEYQEFLKERAKCQVCGADGNWAAYDAYGIYVGRYCSDTCTRQAGYRTDRYFDEGYAGERLEEDY